MKNHKVNLNGRYAVIFLVMLVFFLILSIQNIHAVIPLGSAYGKKSIDILPGDVTSFKILLFNIHEKPGIYVSMNVTELPKGFNITITPKNFYLPYSEPGSSELEEGYEFLGTGHGDIKARVVRVMVKTPQNIEPGKYYIRLSAVVKGPENILTTSQLRSFKFEVNVMGDQNITGIYQENAEKSNTYINAENFSVGLNDNTSSEIERSVKNKPVRRDREEQSDRREPIDIENPENTITGMIGAVSNIINGPYSSSITILIITAVISAALWYAGKNK